MKNLAVQKHSKGIVDKDIFWDALALANFSHEFGGRSINFKTEKVRRKHFIQEFK